MSTISGEDADSPLNFVEDPDAQNIPNISDEYRYQSGGGMMAQEYPKDLNPAEDQNDLSWSDVSGAVSQVGKAIYEGAESVGRAVGLVGPEEKKQEEKPKTTEKTKNPKSPPKPAPLPASQGSQSIKELQEYFSTPTPIMQSMVPGVRYVGKIDGNAGPKTTRVAQAIENALANLLETNKVRGIVLRTSPQDIEGALSKASQYRKIKQQKTASSISRDERIYQLSKILISSS